MKKINKVLISFVGIILLGICIFVVYSYLKSVYKGKIKEINLGKNTTVYTPLYVQKIQDIDSSYYENTKFLSCIYKKLGFCQKSFLKEQKTWSGSLLQVMNQVSLVQGNELFDNCVGDSLSQCYYETVQKDIETSVDESDCKVYISDKAFYNNCLKDMYIKIAIANNDVTICDKNQDHLDRNFCIDKFLSSKSIENKDISYCDKSTDDFSMKLCKDNFYFQVALSINDISFCKKSGNSNEILNCGLNYINQKIINKDIKCEDIENKYKSYLRVEDTKQLLSRCKIEVEGIIPQVISKKQTEKEIKEEDMIENDISIKNTNLPPTNTGSAHEN